MPNHYLVVEEMDCPKCRGTGTICMTRSLDSLWDELGDLLTTPQARDLSNSIRDTHDNSPMTTEFLILADALEKRFP